MISGTDFLHALAQLAGLFAWTCFVITRDNRKNKNGKHLDID